jgi:hypothetical protein
MKPQATRINGKPPTRKPLKPLRMNRTTSPFYIDQPKPVYRPNVGWLIAVAFSSGLLAAAFFLKGIFNG